jgi:hypothetical protein
MTQASKARMLRQFAALAHTTPAESLVPPTGDLSIAARPPVNPCPRCGDTEHQRYCGTQWVVGVQYVTWNCDCRDCRIGSHTHEVEK